MHAHRCLASVAQHEFNALVQDTQSAVDGLKRQRESVVQALEATQQARGIPGQSLDDTDSHVTSLLESLHRLTVALDQVMNEVEQIRSSWAPQGAEPFIVLPFSRAKATVDNQSVLEADVREAPRRAL